MVQLHIKKGDESQFLVETTVQIPIDDLLKEVVPVFNGRLKVNRICAGKSRVNLRYQTMVRLVYLTPNI